MSSKQFNIQSGVQVEVRTGYPHLWVICWYSKPWGWVETNTKSVIKYGQEKNSKDLALKHTNIWSQELAKETQKKQLRRQLH